MNMQLLENTSLTAGQKAYLMLHPYWSTFTSLRVLKSRLTVDIREIKTEIEDMESVNWTYYLGENREYRLNQYKRDLQRSESLRNRL